MGDKTLQATTWKVNFELQSNVSIGNYTLQLALAGAAYAEIQVRTLLAFQIGPN